MMDEGKEVEMGGRSWSRISRVPSREEKASITLLVRSTLVLSMRLRRLTLRVSFRLAGNYLATRSWKGLDANEGLESGGGISVLEQGRSGIARGYGHEKD